MEKLQTVLKVLQTVQKFIVALVAAIGVLITLLPDGLTVEEMFTVGISFAGALGVYAVTNKKQ